MMSEKALTSGGKETIIIERPHRHMTANGMARSTDEATVYVNDLNVIVPMLVLENSTALMRHCPQEILDLTEIR